MVSILALAVCHTIIQAVSRNFAQIWLVGNMATRSLCNEGNQYKELTLKLLVKLTKQAEVIWN